jgi:dynactin complex subunit
LRIEDFIPQDENENTSIVDDLTEELARIKKSMERVRNMYKWRDLTEIEYRKDIKELKERELDLTQALENIEAPIDIERVRDFL